MTRNVLIQIGHLNIESLTKTGLRNWRNVNYLRTSTGSKGERDYFSKKVVPLLVTLLKKVGVNVTLTDAIYHKDIFAKKFDLCISMHYDGGGVENRCMVSSPKRKQGYLNLVAHNKADNFCKIFKSIYPSYTKTINRDNRITSGMLEYYWFDYVQMDSPSVIIEHFNSTSIVGKNLILSPNIVANADYTVILSYLAQN